MGRPITVLVTGGGAPGIAGTLFALRNNSEGIPVRIVTCDMRDDVVGKYLADAFYVAPPADDPNFVESLLKIAISERVDVILPQVTRELHLLSENVEQFKAHGIAIAISSRQSIELANDKWSVLQVAKECGVPVPESWLTSSETDFKQAARALGYPDKKIVVKPRLSNGQRGLRILSEKTWNVTRFLQEKPDSLEMRLDELTVILRTGEWPELIVQEFLPGEEYTIDVFRGNYGSVAVPRLREEIRSGITFKAKVELRKDLQTFALKLAEKLDLRYAFGFQFKLSEDGVPKLLECNPRIQGTMITAMLAGCNVIWWAVKEALGEKVTPTEPDWRANGMRFIRYWGGVAIYGDGKIAGPI